MKLVIFILVNLICFTYCDVYMHNPRGSNNRLNGRNQNVDNNNRLMDTQNNDKGGYVWGPPMHFFVGSELSVEWTNQHACNQPKVTCEIILQYMCNDKIRDGTETTTIPDNANTYNDVVSPNPLTGEPGPVFRYGMHENYTYYQDCKTRERNKGLFTADQNMNNRNSARHTRQDNNGERHGFECPEERDYYPYWHPNPWVDIAVLVSNETLCPYYQRESFNVKPKHYCSEMSINNEIACTTQGHTWMEYAPHGVDAPICEPAPWTRDNHLGNTKDGYASTFNWTIPDTPHEHCVLRLRYNISTGDYQGHPSDEDGTFVDSRFNGDSSPIQQDAKVEYYDKIYELALNTDQLGRTFQDRTHEFAIRERPDFVDDDDNIFNLNVRGKRGNIVQVYPAVEYDFVPNRLHVKKGDYVHFQWTGGNDNPQNNDGEGTRGTDRSNIAQMFNQNQNYPWNQPEEPMFDSEDIMQRMAFLDQQVCTNIDDDEDVNNCQKLNNAGRYFNGGLHRMNRTGEYHYMCTRNNNFSNRSQKGVLFVDSNNDAWTYVAVAAFIALAVLVIGAIIAAGVVAYAKMNPGSAIAGKFELA